MSIFSVEIVVIAFLTSACCIIPGLFLMLRRQSLLSDGISHSVLLGIVVVFYFVEDFTSPLLYLGGTLSAYGMVLLSDWFRNRFHIFADASLVLAFPLFFALAIILINLLFQHLHFDEDMVVLGEITFSPIKRLTIEGVDYGPKALWVLLGINFFNLLVLVLFYKELVLTSFDPTFARFARFQPQSMGHVIILMATFTTIGVFEIVGSILVVALMIIPVAIAALWWKRMITLFLGSLIFSALGSLGGYGLASYLDTSIGGSVVVVLGLIFFSSVLILKLEKGG